MPNWCSNFISIEGSKENILKIKRMLDSVENDVNKPGIFQTLVGRDETLTEQQYNEGGWYQSNIERWGCKWDISWDDTSIDISEENITINCSTAWSPATGFCKLLQETYGVKVRCEFEEGGCDFAGYYEVDENGEVDEETFSYLEGIYVLDKDNFWFEMESRIEYAVDDDQSFDDFVSEMKDFLPDSEIEELRTMYEEEVERRNEE